MDTMMSLDSGVDCIAEDFLISHFIFDPAGSDITFNCDAIANGTGANSDQQFSATGTLTAKGDIEKTTAGNLMIIAGGGVELTGEDSQRKDAQLGKLWVQDGITKTGGGDLTLGGLEFCVSASGGEACVDPKIGPEFPNQDRET